MHAGHDNRVRPDVRFVADYHLFQVERLFVRIPGAVAISVVEARDEDVLAQSHAVAQPDGADHYRADTDARAVADQYVARAVVDLSLIHISCNRRALVSLASPSMLRAPITEVFVVLIGSNW